MNIGFVSTWFERGAAYVTKSYIDVLKESNNVFVYARGGEMQGKGDPNWDLDYVTWGLKLRGCSINLGHFTKWIKKNKIDVIFFNEQKNMDIVYQVKKRFPLIKLGSYIDYYKEDTVKEFNLYDFLICNTKRHYSVFKGHPQSYYVPWGTNTELFTPSNDTNQELTFFHSAGMSDRKGTSLIIRAYLDGQLYNDSKLIIHIQKDFEKNYKYKIADLKEYNIEIIEKTVTAPGLYYLGDVYVYPTMLDGLGLTMYEALSSGLPVITTNHPPMNEVVNDDVGYLVDVDYLRSRWDGYYWPLSIVSKESLVDSMKYFIDNYSSLSEIKETARTEAVKKWEWKDRADEIKSIFADTKVIVQNPSKDLISELNKSEEIMRKIGSTYLYGILKKL